ncbi:unnamed protein product [Blepharisma stoltei]|uniref:Uncharacterized protein n=1 Tax=Blepharisma stoltei TaxID=1481888 RepID=A0AAU9ITR0_9CILI|nr:unnamed protein product [Blepharisma stoltei]
MDYEDCRPISCEEENCEKNVEIICLCDKSTHYLCEPHFRYHLETSSERIHEPMKTVPINQKVLSSLFQKLDWIIEKTSKLFEKFSRKIDKLEKFHRKLLKSITHTRKMINNQLLETIITCKNLKEKCKKPISRKDYYSQLENLLINDYSSYSESIISQMEPPKIEIIKKDQRRLWEKISFYSSTFSHLLSTYNSYCFDITNLGIDVFSLACFDGKKEEKFDNLSVEPSSRMMLISPDEILITGGNKNPKKCDIFNITNRTLTHQNSLNHERYWHCITFIKGFPAVIAGYYNRSYLKAVEIFKYGKWYEFTPLNYPRSSPSACSLLGKVYVVGGNYEHYCEVFDEAIDQWKELIGCMPIYHRMSPGIVGLCENFLIIFGGCITSAIPLNEAVKIDIKNKKESKMPPLEIKGKYSHGFHMLKDKKFYSAMNFSEFHCFINWELKEEINFSPDVPIS